MYCIFGVWLSLARAGARGPRFKSLYPDYGVIRLMVGQEIVDLYVRVRFSYGPPLIPFSFGNVVEQNLRASTVITCKSGIKGY